jgi:Putative DNA-binding domain
MAITNLNFETIGERDLDQLRVDQVAEGITLDYKRDAYDTSDDGKRELLKDTSSFVNTAGGHIVIGMDEVGGLPTGLIGIDLDVDGEMQRLENLFRTCLEPRVVGLRMRPVPLSSGRKVLLIRLPKSWNPPHAVLFKGSRRYFARNSSGVHEASVDELRAMFTANATIIDRISEFHSRRQVAVHGGKTPITLAEPQLLLHVIPFSALSVGLSVDPQTLSGQELPPIFHSAIRNSYNLQGYLTTSGRDGNAGYVQVYRNGIIETAAGGVAVTTDRGRNLPAEDVEDQIATKIEHYLNALRRVEVPPPFAVLLAGVRMHGTAIVPRLAPYYETLLPQEEPDMFFPQVILEDYGALGDYQQALKPIFDALWNAGGYPGSRSYGSDGQWRRQT